MAPLRSTGSATRRPSSNSTIRFGLRNLRQVRDYGRIVTRGHINLAGPVGQKYVRPLPWLAARHQRKVKVSQTLLKRRTGGLRPRPSRINAGMMGAAFESDECPTAREAQSG